MKNDVTLYLDMDGVLADFHKAYLKLDPKMEDRKKFRSSVMDYKIFEDLDFMPDAQELLNHVAKLHGVRVEILTSVGTHDPFQGAEAKRQKLVWLAKHNINYPPNFVQDKQQKGKYANESSILIDDSVGCITAFTAGNGHGILHTTASSSIQILDATILQIRAINSLRDGNAGTL